MRITRAQLRHIIKEELNEMASLRGGIKQIPLFDEEAEAIRLVKALGFLYDDLQGSPHTEQVMDMEAAFSQTREDIKSQKMRQGDIYTMVGMAKAIVSLGLRDPGPVRREEPEEEDL